MLITNVEGLPKGSNKKVDAICDFCGTEVKVSYKLYNRSFTKGNKFSCSRKCAYEKRKQILLESEGVENPSQLDRVKDKRKKTNIERFGVEQAFKSDTIKEKIKETNLKKYGVDNYTKTDEYKTRVKETNLKKYGVEWSLQSEEIKEKSKKTNLEKYGVEKASQSEEVKEKIKKTNLETYGYVSPLMSEEIQEKAKKTLRKNWGVDNPMKSDKIQEKAKKTNLERYGVEYYSQHKDFKDKLYRTNIERYGYDSYSKTDEYKERISNTNLELYGFESYSKTSEFKEKAKKSNIDKFGVNNIQQLPIFRKSKNKIDNDKNFIRYVGDGISLFGCEIGHEFEISSDNYLHRIYLKVPLCTICHPINKAISIKESQIYEFIDSIYEGEIMRSYRDELEIDIYLPELKLGFEFNGLYWHSSDKKDKNYHIDKTEHFKEREIRIIHIWEDDWTFKQEILKSMIKNIIGRTDRKIFARKCHVKEINDVRSVREFLDRNHIQGFVSSKVKLGLYHDSELVATMLFDKNEGRNKMKDNEWNLSRFCNKLNLSVVGGASKLLSYFIKEFNPERIISYADSDWSIGRLYFNLGFKNTSKTDPDYKYIVDGKRIHKSRFRKSKTGLSESDLDILKVYECGKIKFEKFT